MSEANDPDADPVGPPPPGEAVSVLVGRLEAAHDRRAIAAARAWHASLTGDDAAALAAFDADW